MKVYNLTDTASGERPRVIGVYRKLTVPPGGFVNVPEMFRDSDYLKSMVASGALSFDEPPMEYLARKGVVERPVVVEDSIATVAVMAEDHSEASSVVADGATLLSEDIVETEEDSESTGKHDDYEEDEQERSDEEDLARKLLGHSRSKLRSILVGLGIEYRTNDNKNALVARILKHRRGE